MINLLGAALAVTTTLALEPVTIKGNAFYNGSDTRFYIRGVDYQPGGSSNVTDPLANTETCKRDIEHFKDLGVNTIRVYTVDNSENHDECMKALEDAGIYLLLDVNSPHQSLVPLSNQTLKASYNTGYLQHVFATIDAFKNYNNTLGFFSANEVINSENTTIGAPYVKAVTRDMKKYIKAQSKRAIPVGYSAADIAFNRWEQMCYFNCGDDEDERVDMFGMNDYSWCGDQSSFTISGWSDNVKKYSNYSIPMFLSEYGCNKNTPRTFPEVKSLYSTDMSSVYSGGLVYEYSNAENNYGLVEIKGDQVSELKDYGNFKSALAAAPNPTGSAGASTTRQPAQCPNPVKDVWDVDPSQAIPAMPKNAEQYLKNGAGKPLGLDGPNTQSGSKLDEGSDDSSSSASSGSASSATKAATGSASKSATGTSSGTAAATSDSKKKNAAITLTTSRYIIVSSIFAIFASIF